MKSWDKCATMPGIVIKPSAPKLLRKDMTVTVTGNVFCELMSTTALNSRRFNLSKMQVGQLMAKYLLCVRESGDSMWVQYGDGG